MEKYLEEELKLNYLDLCDFLHKKYGVPNGNYFLTESCKSKNQKITRGKEGLFLHHIKENEHIMLCNRDWAIHQPFAYQEGKNLAYCNYLEHLILHYKIVQEYLETGESYELVGIGGILNFIVPEINDYFNGYEYAKDWQKKAFSLVDKKSFNKLKDMIYDFITKAKNPIINAEARLSYPILKGNKGKMTTGE